MKPKRTQNYRKPMSMKYIDRLDTDDTHGYRVRVIHASTIVEPKFFSDRKYGGNRLSKKEAQRYRDTIAKKYSVIITGLSIRSTHKHNRTGEVGVNLMKRNQCYQFVASISRPLTPAQQNNINKKYHRENHSSSILELGYKQAFVDSVKWRYQARKLPLPVTVTLNPPYKEAATWLQKNNIAYNKKPIKIKIN